MLTKLGDLHRADVVVRDGSLGRVRDFYFDDEQWVLRYFIVSTARWLGRDVLVAPLAITRASADEDRLEVGLTRRQVENSPSVDFAQPVSRQKAEQYFAYFGWPYYGGVGSPWGVGVPRSYPPAPPPTPALKESEGDPHLRSFREVTSYGVRGADEAVGHLDDLVVENGTWAVRYLVVDTRPWWPGGLALIPPALVSAIHWHRREMEVAVTRERVRAAPEWPRERPISRADEQHVHAHYGVPPYWVEASGGAELGA